MSTPVVQKHFPVKDKIENLQVEIGMEMTHLEFMGGNDPRNPDQLISVSMTNDVAKKLATLIQETI